MGKDLPLEHLDLVLEGLLHLVHEFGGMLERCRAFRL